MNAKHVFSRLLPALGLVMLAGAGQPPDSGGRDWSVVRGLMLDSIASDVARNSHILDRGRLSVAVSQALAKVPRHEFVPPQYHDAAYANHPLPIGNDQTISQPTIVALMTDLLAISDQDTVLEIGTGSGYQAAILAEVTPHGLVHTIEIVPELARSARKRLADLGYDNVVVHEGDGYRGLPETAPFAGIMVTAAAEEIPQPLIEQLAPGGRLVMPVGAQGNIQWLTILTKNKDGRTTEKAVLAVRFVPMTGEAER